MKHKSYPIFRLLLFVLLFFLGINAGIARLLLMLKPDGSMIQMSLSWLDKTPFTNFFIPGLLLFLLLGCLSLLSFCGMVFRIKWPLMEKLNIYPNRHWAWTFAVYSGFSALIWINVQQVITQFFWIQPVISLIAIAILICTLMPGVMKHYEK